MSSTCFRRQTRPSSGALFDCIYSFWYNAPILLPTGDNLATGLQQYWCNVHQSCIYLLTPWCRVLLEKLTALQLLKKFPAFHGTRRFNTALTSVHQLSLSWASPSQSIYPHPTSWRSILMLSTHLRLGGFFCFQSKHPACECFVT